MKHIYMVLAISVASSVIKAGNSPESGIFHLNSFEAHNPNTVSSNRTPRTLLWSDDFTNTSHWLATTGAGHIPAGAGNPGWEFVTAMPASLINEGSYPTLASNSGGNFAFINARSAGLAATQEATLTWNAQAIDLSTAGTHFITLEWEQIFRLHTESHIVKISLDSGTTWTDFSMNDYYRTDAYYSIDHQRYSNPLTASLPLGNLFDTYVNGGGSLNKIMIAFHYQDQNTWDWYWAIDDIRFITTPDHDMKQLSGYMAAVTPDPIWGKHLTYYTIALNYEDPAGYFFINEAVNEGSQAQPSANVNATVTDNGTIIYTGTGVGATNIAPTDTLRDTTNTSFLLPWNNTDYDIAVETDYTNQTNDFTPTNNYLNSLIEVNNMDGLQGRASLKYSNTGIWSGMFDTMGANAFIVGSQFYFHNFSNANIEHFFVALHPSTQPNAIIFPFIIQLDTGATNFQSAFANVIYDGTQIAGGEYVIQASDISSGGNIHLLDLPLQSLVCVKDGSYLIGIGSLGGEKLVVMSDTNYTTPGTNFIFEWGTSQWCPINSAPLIFLEFPFYEYSNPNPCPTGIKGPDKNYLDLFNYPNPSQYNTTISYSLAKPYNQVSIQWTDIYGKIIQSIDLGARNAGNYDYEFDVSGLSNGVYYFTLQAEEQKITQIMVVSR